MQNEREKFKKNLEIQFSLHFELHFDFCILIFELFISPVHIFYKF